MPASYLRCFRLPAVITLDDVWNAASRLAGVATHTPVILSPELDELAGCQLFLKAENLQLTGSFKFRGAYNAIRSLDAEQIGAGVVAFSSGNHAQAIARAAALCQTTAVIVMPTDAPPEKVEGVRASGATIVSYDRYGEDREAIAQSIATDENRVLIKPYDNPLVMAGQGTTALELLDQVGNLDAIFVCVGGGGLLAGCATVVSALAGEIEVHGVEPEAGNDHALSQAAGERVVIDIPRTIADGQQVSTPGELTWPITSRGTKSFPVVSDQEIVSAMRLLFEHTKLVVEPSGASALAAVLNRGDLGLEGKRVGVTLSGGNIGWTRFCQLIGDQPDTEVVDS